MMHGYVFILPPVIVELPIFFLYILQYHDIITSKARKNDTNKIKIPFF